LLFEKSAQVSFCSNRDGLKNVNRRFRGAWVKVGGIKARREAIAESNGLGGFAMDGKIEALKGKLERLLREAAAHVVRRSGDLQGCFAPAESLHGCSTWSKVV
jgi:hypothetical protein